MIPRHFTRSIASIALIVTAVALQAQESSGIGSDEEVTILAPFQISSVSGRSFDPRYRRGNLAKVPVQIIKRADAVILELTVSSDDKKPEKRIASLQAAFRALKASVASRNDITMKNGYVELPLVNGSRWSFSSDKTRDEIASFNLTLITKLGPTDTIFDRIAVLNEFAEDIEFDGGVKVLYVSSGVALIRPDQYRMELLQLIAREVNLMKSIFGETIGFQIKGLDEKVHVRQIDEVNLELSIPYQLILHSTNN